MNPQVQATVRLLMDGKEVGSIIGKKGETIRSMRLNSGAYINISDGISPERIVTLTGTLSCLSKAISMINRTLKESKLKAEKLILRVVVPAVNIGSIIGKSGNKIKRIREITNASIQIDCELLPNSTEKIVNISGQESEIEQCFIEICKILMECPLKADSIPYRPYTPMNNVTGPFILINNQPYQIQGSLINTMIPNEVYDVVPYYTPMNFVNIPTEEIGQVCSSIPAPTNDSLLIASSIHSKQLIIPNDLIGCIIGKGGQKISEIRQTSGANIKIADITTTSKDRNVTLNGTVEQIILAEAMIQSRIASEVGGITK